MKRTPHSKRPEAEGVQYVLNNARKHGVPIPERVPDPYSSARWFPNWGERFRKPLRSPPVACPRRAWPWNPGFFMLDRRPGHRAESQDAERLRASLA